jgi:hypothetical protein
MQFHDYLVGGRDVFELFYNELREGVLRNNLLLWAAKWYEARRPYYKCWPALLGAMCKIKLDRTLREFAIKPQIVLLRFGLGDEPQCGNIKILCIGVACVERKDSETTLIVMPLCENQARKQLLLHHSIASEWDETLEVVCHDEPYNSGDEACDTSSLNDTLQLALRISLSCLILAEDSEYITPDVLSKDEPAYRLTHNQKYVDKAHRKGKLGWDIGKHFETIPHARRPHMAIRHTGPRGSIPRIVAVKGCIVHRKKATRVPTGHFDIAGHEIEPD